MSRSIAVVGAGISGLATAHAIAMTGVDDDAVTVTLLEQGATVGGKISSSDFAGVANVDEGADAFLARVPEAAQLAVTVNTEQGLIHPEQVGASVWHDGLHPIPDGLLLGMPGKVLPLARTRLLSIRGKVRAAIEPLLPRTSLSPDSVGAFVRARFGDEVHERLVDALVGSIYATDTDDFSLAEVPQLHDLATRHRSMLLGARATRQKTPMAGTAASSPIFAAPPSGMGTFAGDIAAALRRDGSDIRLNSPVTTVKESSGPGWLLDGEHFDAVVFATPAAATARAIAAAAPESAGLLGRSETADVIMVTLHVSAAEWPDRLAGSSGYLVPKPVQRSVTAASFGSQKWGHWQPPTGGQILRVSLGRDGQPVLHLSDDEVVERVLDDLDLHLGVRFTPNEVRITRWPAAFAQYRPHHGSWVDDVEASLPAGLFVVGASYRGMGIPACVRQGTTIGERAADHVRGLTQ